MSSKNLDKYEYLTGKDLSYKPNTVEQAKFDYSPMSKFFNKGLKKEDKKEGLSKRLKNIEDKSEEQLKAIKSMKEWKHKRSHWLCRSTSKSRSKGFNWGN